MCVQQLRLIVDAGEAKPGGLFAPILAQSFVSLVDFCKRFNALTTPLYIQGVPLGVKLYVEYPSKAFEIYSYRLMLTFLMKQLIESVQFGLISLCSLFDLLAIFCGSLEQINIKLARVFFGMLVSYGCRRIDVYNVELVRLKLWVEQNVCAA